MQIRIIMVFLFIGLIAETSAELHDRGSGMIYDDVLDITWLQDANAGRGSIYDDGEDTNNGQMNWYNAVAWTDNLVFGGFDDWRLASMDVNGDDTVVNCNGASEVACRDNELGYMFYWNLMGSSGDDLTGAQGLFTGIQDVHWSGTAYVPTNRVWDFYFNWGSFGAHVRSLTNRGAWAVRDGDVFSVDVDGDGVFDSLDNCTLVANPIQRDTDGDGFGNICDLDFDQNCVVNFIDFNIMAAFFLVPGDFDTDLNGDGVTNFLDVSYFPSSFLLPPGPSFVTNDCD